MWLKASQRAPNTGAQTFIATKTVGAIWGRKCVAIVPIDLERDWMWIFHSGRGLNKVLAACKLTLIISCVSFSSLRFSRLTGMSGRRVPISLFFERTKSWIWLHWKMVRPQDILFCNNSSKSQEILWRRNLRDWKTNIVSQNVLKRNWSVPLMWTHKPTLIFYLVLCVGSTHLFLSFVYKMCIAFKELICM